MTNDKACYGVIGAGSFGTAIANILAANGNVLVYTRNQAVFDCIKNGEMHRNHILPPNVYPTMLLEEVCQKCQLIFPVVPSSNFREMMRNAAPHLKPNHILIHCTKGLNVELPDGRDYEVGTPLRKDAICTMSRIIREESLVMRIGCLSGPNLAKELAEGQLAATVIASRFDEVIHKGQNALKSDRFRVYGSSDVLGVELAGVLKNIMAIAAGMLNGMGMGENAKSLLVSRGLGEMVKLGRALGASTRSFLGLAGVGDLVATCSSVLSRNFRVGKGLAEGKDLDFIIEEMKEVAEGVNTVKLAKGISLQYGIDLPIVDTLYDVLYNGVPIEKAILNLMNSPLDVDADFWLT